MNLYHIQDTDRPMHVIAGNWNEAIAKWKDLIKKENPDVPPHVCDMDEPQGITLVASQDDLIL